MSFNKGFGRKRPILCFKSILKRLSVDLLIDPQDLSYALRRLQQEGPSFITKILPKFSAYALKSCEAGRPLSVKESGLTHFAWNRRSPCFMQGLLLRAIDGDAIALFKIRQFCDYVYKLALGFSPKEIAKATDKYVKTDSEVSGVISLGSEKAIRNLFHMLFPKLSKVEAHDIFSQRTRNGPGSFQGSKAKTTQLNVPNPSVYKKLPADLVGLCPAHLKSFAGYFKAYPTSGEAVVTPKESRICEVTFVPKDSRGPRVISMEPYLLLKAQMAYQDYVSRALEIESNFHVNFRSQEINREICKESSTTREYASLDLRDASDRVGNGLVKSIFRYSPGLRYFTRNCRSEFALLPNGDVIRLRKFANMGSGLCFPTLALVVYLAATLGVHRYHRSQSLRWCAKKVFVFGDDLLVPRECVPYVRESLEKYGLALNDDKCYSSGYFRESCGADYYHGISVSPVRLRLTGAGFDPIIKYRNGFLPLASKDSRHVKPDLAVLQLERHCRELVDAGLYSLADYMYSQCERYLGEMPKVSKDSPALGRYSPHNVPQGAAKGYLAIPDNVTFDAVCPLKGLGAWSMSVDGLGQDWSLTPVRRSISLKRRVLEPFTLVPYGLAEVPDCRGFNVRNNFV